MDFFKHSVSRPEDRPSFGEVCELMKAATDAGDDEIRPEDDDTTPTQEFPPPPTDLEEDVELNELLRLEEQLVNSPVPAETAATIGVTTLSQNSVSAAGTEVE